MVACEDAKTTRVNREGFMKTKFHRKVCDRTAIEFGVNLARPGIGLIHVRIIKIKDPVIRCNVFLILGSLVQTRTAHFTQHSDRKFKVINCGLPSETVSGLSEPDHAGGKFPRPDLHERLGRVLAKNEILRITTAAARLGVPRHCDGARIWNAAIATGDSERELSEGFDTVSVCFSKGLGAPVGSALAGTAEAIGRARKIRKRLGGGMRQAGVIAAGALHALRHHRARIAEDHRRAATLAAGIRSLARDGHPLRVEIAEPNTNMVYFRLERGDPDRFTAALGVLAFWGLYRGGLYAIMLPGVLAGLGGGYLIKRRVIAVGTFAAIVSLPTMVLTEWWFRPFVKDESLSFFLAHLNHLPRAALLMMLLGVAAAFWFGIGREAKP